MDPALVAAVIVAMAGLIGVAVGVILVQRGFNRRRILLFSALGTAVAFLALSVHFFLDKPGKLHLSFCIHD